MWSRTSASGNSAARRVSSASGQDSMSKGHMGVLGPGETCITASTRNFKGRMGDATARIYMASPETEAASAVAGGIAHPEKQRLIAPKQAS
jgi:homoaconitase/3-isopropylmalate dehydratase large subunit